MPPYGRNNWSNRSNRGNRSSRSTRSKVKLLSVCLMLTFGWFVTYSAASFAATIPRPAAGTARYTLIPRGAVATKVVKVVDGDTMDVLLQGKEFRVRYTGVNTPETKNPKTGVEYFGREAEKANQTLVGGPDQFKKVKRRLNRVVIVDTAVLQNNNSVVVARKEGQP